MPTKVGFSEILILAVIVLVFFGPSRLPEIGRSLGKGIRGFRASVAGRDDPEANEPPPP